jgi:hypothetical protein
MTRHSTPSSPMSRSTRGPTPSRSSGSSTRGVVATSWSR